MVNRKSQTTILPADREIRDVEPGEELIYEDGDDKTSLRREIRVTPELASLDRLLVEWSDPANNVYDELFETLPS